MFIQRIMKYKEGYLPSPRHRKERFREAEAEFAAEIPETTAANAPVVLKVHEYEHYADGIQVKDYRQYNGQLYIPVLRHEYFNCADDAECRQQAVGNEFATRLGFSSSYHFTKDEVASKYQEMADQFLVIDGMVWKRTSEPYYYVQTLGLGNNHGGTALMITDLPHHTYQMHTFSALQREEAVKTAIKVALDRGDTDAVPCLQKNDRYIEVIDPDAVQFQRVLRTFLVEKSTTGEVAVKAVNYTHALELAKQLPASCYKEIRTASYRNGGKTENASVVYTEEDVKALTKQPQEETSPSLSDMKTIAEAIVKTLETRSVNNCTYSSGYIVIREFGNEIDRAVDVYKSDGNGKDIPHYVIYCSYEDDTSDFAYTADLSVEGLTKVLEEFYNAPVEDGSETEVSEPMVATEQGDAPEISKMLTISTAHICPGTWDILESEGNDRCETRFSALSVYPKSDYGCFIYISGLDDALEIDFPADLLDVVKFAIDHGCNMLCIDSDGPTVPELKTYEW